MASLAEIPLPPHDTVVQLPEFEITLSPEYARALVMIDELFGPIRVEKRRDLRPQW